EHLLAHGLEIGEGTNVLDIDADPVARGDGDDSEFCRVRDIEGHAATLERHRQLWLAVWTIREADVFWQCADTLGQQRAQRDSKRHEANRVVPEPKSSRPILLVVAKESAQALDRPRLLIKAHEPDRDLVVVWRRHVTP